MYCYSKIGVDDPCKILYMQSKSFLQDPDFLEFCQFVSSQIDQIKEKNIIRVYLNLSEKSFKDF